LASCKQEIGDDSKAIFRYKYNYSPHLLCEADANFIIVIAFVLDAGCGRARIAMRTLREKRTNPSGQKRDGGRSPSRTYGTKIRKRRTRKHKTQPQKA